ncbi:GTP pyrophosphokinase, (p)ppGpp synthetase II / Guanosine-3',5'-bis(diphosphate) 3'-pyrophosphohydrolase [hydrothermal vent metagenome]|uniref:GTP pyrophosphokinase, (P)ppGpp synthetase II / Guanosine-3',5'-bis(Diphosphate) 3'-pyrophosphohydrolase n=1 Tax=hydrothermal vent metagenome TaxID=652676 RepID=A0A1W1BSA4_9ZZZZ
MSSQKIDIKKLQSIKDVESAETYLFKLISPTKKIKEALDFAKEAHKTQQRKSGEPYIIHPILVAAIVASISSDEAMVIAALLHDVVEDTEIPLKEIEKRYGGDVALLVEGMTKIDLIRDKELIPSYSDEKLVISALTFRKMLLASIKDVRVLVVKLCDRLHNMLTLDALPSHKQVRISEETLVVYAPIAHRLGISFIKNLLEDLSFSYLFPKEKAQIEEYLQTHYHQIELRLNDFKEELSKLLLKNGFKEEDFEILSRIKHNYSIYLKMQRKGISIEEILDLLAVRILVKEDLECYKVLGLVHLHFHPLASRLKDYIAVPKENGYQTLHTTVFHDKGIFEVQIRTFEMHKTAELGVAAHWKYKSGGANIKLDWLDNLQYQGESIEDFYALIKNDLYSEDISIFSPKGDVFTLPRGAVALDFAYAVHTEVGNRADEALVNKKRVSLLTELHNGDIVKIKTSKENKVRCSWIDAVKTSKAKSNMKYLCNARLKEINSEVGKNILSTAMNLNYSRVNEWIALHQCQNIDNLATDADRLKEVINRYIQDIAKNSRFKSFLSRHRFKLKKYLINGIEIYSAYHVSKVVFDYCCHPKYGDEIVGFYDKGVVHIHHKMCQEASKKIAAHQKMVLVKWEKKNLYNYKVIVSLQNKKGALAEFLTYLAKLDINIASIEFSEGSEGYYRYCELLFESGEADLNELRGKIEQKFKVIHMIRTDDAYK